ncbi:UNVERIFIED_CONTAM: hypothetical protein HDU68_008606 [Siphonaria sp. JEL0065]|nr:hypothetical protein HDU68_008606 [Siphonaria sp. JEL0065]
MDFCDDEYQAQLDEYFQSLRKLPQAKLRWDKQKTLWKAREFKDIHHSIFLNSKKQEEGLLPPLRVRIDSEATNAVYNEDPAFDHKVQAKMKNVIIPAPIKVDPALFDRLSHPKCPTTPPLPADALVALTKPRAVGKDFFQRLYAEQLHKQCHHEDENDHHLCATKSKHKPVDAAFFQRLAVPKAVKYEERQVLPSIGKKPDDVDALIGRLSKPRYYIVWKKKGNESSQ